LSVPEGRPTQCGSWRHTKQPYVCRLFIWHQDREIVGSKVLKVHYFCIRFSFVVILMKNFEIYIMNRYYGEETPEFFPEISVHIFQQKTMFLAEKRNFNIYQFGKPAMRDPLGHEICRLITQSIGLSQRNTRNFFQDFIFIRFSRNDL